MALIFARHIVRQPIGEAHRYLAQLAASGGTTLVRLLHGGVSDGAHPVSLDERPRPGRNEPGTWWSCWRAGERVPAASGTIRLRLLPDNATMLEFSGSYASPQYEPSNADDAYAFRNANAFVHSYLAVMADGIEAGLAA